MDLAAVAGMVFTLIVLMLIGGFILLFPLTRRLGHMLELWMQDRRPIGKDTAELNRLRETVQALEAEVRTLAERQEFVDGLLRGDPPQALPRERSGPAGPS